MRKGKGGSHEGSMDGSRHGGHPHLQPPPSLDYTFNVHSKGANGDGAPYPVIRNDSNGSFLDEYPGDSPYGSVGGSLVRVCRA